MNTPHRFRSCLAPCIDRFLTHHRALGKRFNSAESALRLFDRYLTENDVDSPSSIAPALIEGFLRSRPRSGSRSYNHLLNVLQRLFRWLVAQEVLPSSPVRTRPRRETQHRTPFLFEPAQAERLLAVAANLDDGPRACRRGPSYRMMFALMYGLGLRVGEVSRLRREDLDLERQCLHIAGTKFGKSRLVPFGPRMCRALRSYLQQHDRGRYLLPHDPLFSRRRTVVVRSEPRALAGHSASSCLNSAFVFPLASRPHACIACANPSRYRTASEPYQTGCLLAAAQDVPAATRRLRDIEHRCIPWHFLFDRSTYSRSAPLRGHESTFGSHPTLIKCSGNKGAGQVDRVEITLTKGQILLYADHYGDVADDKRVARRLSVAAGRGYLTLDDLENVSRWKSPRRMALVANNREADVRETTSVSLAARSERLRIGALRSLHGIEWPRASAILHFVFPERYPILDVRAMRTVGGPANGYTFEVWEEYARLCRQKAAQCGVTLRQLDRALWTFDRDRYLEGLAGEGMATKGGDGCRIGT